MIRTDNTAVFFIQNGLHSEVCEIDYKLHHIIAGRKRSVIQSIQEETATNIYFPSVLSGGGILGARSASLVEKQNIIFITGEFFGVQRAREMLFQVSMHKVSTYFQSRNVSRELSNWSL